MCYNLVRWNSILEVFVQIFGQSQSRNIQKPPAEAGGY
jgi:hypothetical protein